MGDSVAAFSKDAWQEMLNSCAFNLILAESGALVMASGVFFNDGQFQRVGTR